jgi:Pregnancy-associated plasma protein-A
MNTSTTGTRFTTALLVVLVVLHHNCSSARNDDDLYHSNHDDALEMEGHNHQQHNSHYHHHHGHSDAHGLRSITRLSQSLSNMVDDRNSPTSTFKRHRHLSATGSTSTNMVEQCGTKSPTTTDLQEASRVVSKWVTSQLLQLKQAQSVEIETYFHVITNGFNATNITSVALDNQIAVLNDSFRPHGFAFRLITTSYTTNVNWYNAGVVSQDQMDMKAALRVGDKSTLNVYFNAPTGISSGTLLGYATLPSDYRLNPTDDGVVLYGKVVPGGPFFQFNKGITLVHEVGHWLGLYHTFNTDFGFFQNINYLLYLIRLRNGCNTAGDDVKDTPAQRSPTFGCPEKRDSCLFRRGSDPIHNYMEYTDDICRTEFTPGQSERMWAMWSEYRAP